MTAAQRKYYYWKGYGYMADMCRIFACLAYISGVTYEKQITYQSGDGI